MKKDLHPQRNNLVQWIFSFICIYKKITAVTLHFKLHLIGNISYLDISEAKLGLQKDYVWCLQLKDTGLTT